MDKLSLSGSGDHTSPRPQVRFNRLFLCWRQRIVKTRWPYFENSGIARWLSMHSKCSDTATQMCARARWKRKSAVFLDLRLTSIITGKYSQIVAVIATTCSPLWPTDQASNKHRGIPVRAERSAERRGGEHENQARHVDTRAVSTCCQPEAR